MFLDKINSLDASNKLFLTLQTNKNTLSSTEQPPKIAENMNFDSTFPGMHINKPQYTNCRFKGSIFERPAGESSRFHSCSLCDCKFLDGDFRYCNFENTIFISQDEVCFIHNSNFSYGILKNTKFIKIDIQGTPFREMLIDSCVFTDCSFKSFGFERTTIKNCVFENIDLSKIVFRFCSFNNVKFINVTLHILDLAKNYGLINELCSNGSNVKIFYGNNNYMSLKEAIALLPNLIPYYLNQNEYYYVINILILDNKKNEIWNLLPEALKYVIKVQDYAYLQDLCSLIVKVTDFNQKKLNQLYNLITLNVTPNSLSSYQLKSYSSYMENIKNILLNNPKDFPTASITICTNILPYNIEKLSSLLKAIENNIYEKYPNVIPRIQISHNSPYNIIILISAVLPELLHICQMFYYTFGGIKSLKDIMSSRHEKAINQKDNNKIISQKISKSKKVSFGIGKISFQYYEECEDIVESVEYLIT